MVDLFPSIKGRSGGRKPIKGICENPSNIINKSALNSLSDAQVEASEYQLSRLVQEKSGDIDKISNDSLLVAWEMRKESKIFLN